MLILKHIVLKQKNMSNARYIEPDSTYRNRVLWPYPAEFEIPISQSGRKGQLDALDPVSLSAPIASWSSNVFDLNLLAPTVTGTIDVLANSLASSGSPDTFIIVTAAGSLQPINNYYNNAVLINTTLNISSRILKYIYLGTNGAQDRAQIIIAEPYPSSALIYGNNISISDPTDLSYPLFPLFFIPAGLIGDNRYTNYFLYNETRQEWRKILSYDPTTHIVSIDNTSPVVPPWTATDNYSIRKSPPELSGTIAAGTTTNSIILTAPTLSPIDDAYNGQFIRILKLGSGLEVAPENEIRRIVSYVGATTTANVSPPFSAVPLIGAVFELLPFSFDNLSPMVYSGSIVSQQELVSYEITLLNLILPNLTLSSGYGSRIAFYPYVYVEFSPYDATNRNIIYSNNPNATRALFRIPVHDVQNPLLTSFVKLTSSMTQTIKFKPNTNLYFSVRLPNGDLYQTSRVDQYSPLPPDPNLQISAVFSIKKL